MKRRLDLQLTCWHWPAWIKISCVFLFFQFSEVKQLVRAVHSEVVRMAGNVKRFYALTANLLSGEMFSFSALKGKVVLIENVASLWGTTTRDYTQMNELHSRYSDKGLVILGVPCNQFGHQVRRVRFETWATLFSRWRVLCTQPIESHLYAHIEQLKCSYIKAIKQK